MRSLANPRRGCGTMKEGGFYGRGDISPNGTLNAWTWALGSHLLGALNYAVTVPARQMGVCNLPATLYTGRLVNGASGLAPLDLPESIKALPIGAVIDHIGSAHYTPWQFAQEVRALGPSRRIPENVAKVIAKHTPIPIVFTHSHMPLVPDDEKIAGPLKDWANVPDDAFYGPTPFMEGWGLNHGDKKGEEHWIIPILRALDLLGVTGENSLLKSGLGGDVTAQLLMTEQIIGISWITRCVYIAPEGETDERLSEIEAAGIEPVRLEEAEDAGVFA
jgi:hypothetical protein